MTDSPRNVLISIDDAVFRLDVESAFSGAGFQVVRPGLSESPLPGNLPISLALIDADPPSTETISLYRAVRRRRIPVMAFTPDELDGTIGRKLKGHIRLVKPLATDQLVAQASEVMSREPGETAWKDDAPAAGSATA